MGQNQAAEPSLEHLLALAHLTSSVSHHIINAFSAIVSNAEILRLSTESESVSDTLALVETIVRTSLEASSVSRRLIDFTRPHTVAGSEPVDLERLADEVIAAERGQAGAKISWTLTPAFVPPIRGHVEHLRLVLRHLIANALEAMPEAGGTITLATSRDTRGWIQLEVRDTGQGMPPEVQERALEPFFTTKPGRDGVGLNIANGIWRRHRGTMSIRSQEGAGTQVRLSIES
jgi:two-component system NtrC family sensor kinase